MSIFTGYLYKVLDVESLKRTNGLMTKLLKAHDSEFDAIAFRGMSGAMIAPMLAAKLKKNLLMVRKPDQQAHSSRAVEGILAPQRYVIVDDLISSGRTIDSIVEEIKNFSNGSQCIGIALYHVVGGCYDSFYNDIPIWDMEDFA